MSLVIEADRLTYDVRSETWLVHDTHYLWSDENLHDAAEEMIADFGFQSTDSVWSEASGLQQTLQPFEPEIVLRIYGEDEAGEWDDCFLRRKIEIPLLPLPGAVWPLPPTRAVDYAATIEERAFPEGLVFSDDQYRFSYDVGNNKLEVNCELAIKPFAAFSLALKDLKKYFGFTGYHRLLKDLD